MRISDWSSDVVLFRSELGQPLAQGVGEALLQVGALAARLARVFGQRFAQHVQALVGAGAEFGQARAEAFDALRLRAGQAVELLAQLAAAVALLLAQRRLQREPGLAQQKNDQQDDRRTNGDQQEQQQLGIGHAASVRSEEHTSELPSLMRISY